MYQAFIKSSALALFASSLFCASSVIAHHGASAHFDLSVEVKVEGILTDFRMVNPHGYVYFDGLNAEGGMDEWRCEMGTNLRARASEETILPGGRVLVTGNPAWREDFHCKLEYIEHEDGRTIGFNGSAEADSTDYVPSNTLMALVGGERPDTEQNILSVGSSEKARNRSPVEVPSEGLFGNWYATGLGWIGMAGVGGMGNNNAEIVSDLPQPSSFMYPTYTAAGEALLESYDERYDNPTLQCESSIFDGMAHHGFTNEFVQDSEDTIRYIYGFMDLYRTFHMNMDEHPEDLEPSVLGHSIAHWEGDTLVVNTKGFSKQWLYGASRQGTVLGSEELHVTERYTHDADNDHLVIEYVAEDPLYWEEPMSGVIRMVRSELTYQPYDCIELAGDNNRREDGTTIFDR